MGLDMYLYKIQKPMENTEQLSKMGYENIHKKYYIITENDETPPNFQSIIKFTTKIKTKQKYTDCDKLKRNNNIPVSARLIASYSQQQGTITHIFQEENMDEPKSVTLPTEQLNAEYTAYKDITAYVFDTEEIGYWRKEYDLREDIHAACDIPIKNCGYYPITNEMWNTIEKADPDIYDKVKNYRNNNASSIIVYHEWY